MGRWGWKYPAKLSLPFGRQFSSSIIIDSGQLYRLLHRIWNSSNAQEIHVKLTFILVWPHSKTTVASSETQGQIVGSGGSQTAENGVNEIHYFIEQTFGG